MHAAPRATACGSSHPRRRLPGLHTLCMHDQHARMTADYVGNGGALERTRGGGAVSQVDGVCAASSHSGSPRSAWVRRCDARALAGRSARGGARTAVAVGCDTPLTTASSATCTARSPISATSVRFCNARSPSAAAALPAALQAQDELALCLDLLHCLPQQCPFWLLLQYRLQAAVAIPSARDVARRTCATRNHLVHPCLGLLHSGEYCRTTRRLREH
jgi:hypothetical protein